MASVTDRLASRAVQTDAPPLGRKKEDWAVRERGSAWKVRSETMRRAVAVVVSLLWCGLLLGCAAITDPASHVGATGATLNAHGQTESSPATYFFQYALTESGFCLLYT